MCHFRYIFIHARSWVLDSASLGFLYRFPARTILVLLPANSGNQQATHLHDRWLLLLGYPLHWTDAWADRSQFHCSSDSQETRAVQPLHNQHKLEKGGKERKSPANGIRTSKGLFPDSAFLQLPRTSNIQTKRLPPTALRYRHCQHSPFPTISGAFNSLKGLRIAPLHWSLIPPSLSIFPIDSSERSRARWLLPGFATSTVPTLHLHPLR